ncbi:MAG: hypothetical protein Q9226_001230 [Calogaya cf. arnoldii]
MSESNTRSARKPSVSVSSDKATTAEGDKQGQAGSTVGPCSTLNSRDLQLSGLTQMSQLRESGTWYKGGTWRRASKATPVTQVAKESIFAATDKASELVTTARNPITQGIVGPKRSPSTYLCRNIESPSRSSSLDVSAKKKTVEATSSRNPHEDVKTPTAPTNILVSDQASTLPHKALQEKPAPNPTIPPGPSNPASVKESEIHNPKANADAPLWRAWFSRYEEPSKPAPESLEAGSAMNKSTTESTEPPIKREISNPELTTAALDQATVPRPWLGLWGAARPAKAEPIDTAASVITTNVDRPQTSNGSATPTVASDAPSSDSQTTSTAKSPGWAFWSRDTIKDGEDNRVNTGVGELALAGSPSQSHPESAILDEAHGTLGKRPRSVESAQKVGASQSQRQKIQKEVSVEPKSKVISNKPVESEPRENDGTKNLLLPHITATYRPVERPSFMQTLNRLWQYNRSSGAGQVELLDNPPRIKRALTIGVHGYFPAPLIRSVLGQPTGTSIRFADGAANAIHKWTEARGYSCDIEKVALEGEGKILERVDVLWKLLLNWTDNIRRADFIMVACHSQGVPVAIMLIAKLIEFGCVQDAKIGVCAMAGVNLGPFVDYKSRWIGGSARELFDFAQADSQVSKDYHAALTTILNSGVRVAYVGSIDDQLVSLDSYTPGGIRTENTLAVENTLQVTATSNVPLKKIREDTSNSQNPYILPFSLRGVLEEAHVKNELQKETMELLQQFDAWKPSSKVLKDVKFRLEGVRSKL